MKDRKKLEQGGFFLLELCITTLVLVLLAHSCSLFVWLLIKAEQEEQRWQQAYQSWLVIEERNVDAE